MRSLIESVFLDGVSDPEALAMGDGAVVPFGDRFLVLTADAHVGLLPGDAIVMTGTIGDHGLAVLIARHGLGLRGDLRSDVAPLNGLIRAALAAAPAQHAMKAPTRGGVTSALSEMAHKAGVAVILQEDTPPMSDAARAAAELLGIDPLTVANEGKALLAVHPLLERLTLEVADV